MTCISKYTENKKLRLFLFYLSFFAVFCIILFLNIKTPLLGDDYTYTYIFASTEKIQGIGDIIQSQYNHYYKWGGRTVVHTIAQLLLLLPPLAMDVINSLAFVMFILLIYYHINRKRQFSVSLLLGIFLLVWFLEPFGETVLWITGSANYMWGALIILAFLLPYRFYNNTGWGRLNQISRFVLMLLGGILTGWTNENVGAGLLLIIVLFLFYFKSQKWIIPLWAYSGLIGALIGYLLMITAPGNAARAAQTTTDLLQITYRLFRYTQTLFNYLGLLNLCFVVLFAVVLKKKQPAYKQVLSIALIFELAALASVYVMLFSPSFPERAWFGVIVFNIIAVGILLVNINLPAVRSIKYAFVGLGICVFVLNSYDVIGDVLHVDKELKKRELAISNAKKEGKKTVVIEKYETKTKYAVADPTYALPLISIFNDIEIKYDR